MSNLQSSPEKFGLSIVGEVEFSSGGYEFDTSIVWRDIETGALYFGDDSGCSCPEPFGDWGRDQLTKVGRMQDLIDYFEKRRQDSYRYDPDEEYGADDRARIDGAIGELILKAERSTS